jgi:4-amino-4-deoxy-L-arabinose transferase-like glycosyltransferase
MTQHRWLSWGFWLFAAAHLLLWTVIPLLIQPNPPLDAVEIVAWGHEWQFGYPKHPPLAPWLAEAARSLGGHHGLWPIYVLGQLCVVIAFWAVWRLGRELTTPPIALAAVLVLEATGRYTWMTLELNHSLVVLPFFPLSALCLYCALTTGRLRWWLATGGALGLGMMAKYTIGLLALAMVVFLLSSREARRRAAGPGPYLALGVATLILLPHVVWVVANGFPTISYVVERSKSDAGWTGHLTNPAGFLASQFLMLELFWLALLLLVRWPWRLRPPIPGEHLRRQFLFAVSVGPCVVLLALSAVTGLLLRDVWGMPIWSMLALWLLLGLDLPAEARVLKRAALACALFAVVNVLLALAEGVAGPYVIGSGFRTHFPGRLLAERVVEVWRERYDAPLQLVGGERWLAGNVDFWAPSRPSTFTNLGLRTPMLDEVACPWTSVADFLKRGGVLVWPIGRESAALPWELRKYFPDAEVLPPLTLPYQTSASVAPVQVGIAIVPPGSSSPGAENRVTKRADSR